MRNLTGPLVVVETHPVQYHAPVYRSLSARFGVPVTAVYGSDFSVAGSFDREFGASFAWDTDLLSGYESVFLSRVGEHGADAADSLSARHLPARLRLLNPSAILLTGYTTRFCRSAFVAAVRSGLPALLRAETTDHARRRNRAKAGVRDLILRMAYRSCTALLYIGARSRSHYLRLGVPESKLHFSPYCVETAPFRTDEAAREALRLQTRRELEIEAHQVAIVFSGKLSPRKGVECLVRSVKLLEAPLRQRIVLVFLGSGELEPVLKSLAQVAPEVAVRFLGFRNQTQLSAFYHAADVLALPSLHSETWGLVVNEALHHGVPCVVSDAVGCVPDLIDPGVTGEVAETGSESGLAAAITRCVRLVGCPGTRSACRRKVGGYTVEKAAEGIAIAYNSIVERRRTAAA